MRAIHRFTLTIVIAVLSSGVATADVLAPATSVSIARAGTTLTAPSAKTALDGAQAGDVITLGPGTHAGPLIIRTSGIKLVGAPGARINGNSDHKFEWVSAPEYGPNTYTSPIPWQPVTMAIDQRVMIDATASRNGLAVHRVGSGRNGREPLGGVFTYLPAKKCVVVSFSSGVDPAKHLIEAAKLGESAVTVRAANDVVIENLIITGGANGVLLHQTKGTTVRGCLIYGTDAGVRLAQGATECRILANDITWNDDALHTDADPASADVGADVWHTHKKFGTYDKFGIAVDRAGENNEIAGNYIYNVWNGITTEDGVGKADVESHYKEKVFKGIVSFNRGLKVHHNRLDLTLDDALEPGNELADNQWYGNVVSRARCATRIKTQSIGPFYYYNNVLFDSMDGLRLYKSVPETATTYILHNVVQFPTGVIYHEMDSVAWDDPWLKKTIKQGTPNFHIFNNVFVCKTPFANNSDNNVPPNFKGDYNLYTAPASAETTSQGIDAHGIFSAQPAFVDAGKGDFHLAVGSAGAGAAMDLAKLPGNPTLPSNLAQLVGRHLDVGLLPAGANTAPTGPVTPLWDLSKAQLNLGERDLSKITITPLRWVAGPTIDYAVTDLPSDAAKLRFVRTHNSGKSGFKLEIVDESGRVRLKRDGAVDDINGFDLTIPTEGAKALRVRIADDSAAAWQLTAGDATVGLDASKGVALRKYDGAPFAFAYVVDASTGPFTVTTSGSAEVVAPDGTRSGGKTLRIDPAGKPGTYRVAVSFNKSGTLKLEGKPDSAGGVLTLEPAQPVTLKPMWGKPKF